MPGTMPGCKNILKLFSGAISSSGAIISQMKTTSAANRITERKLRDNEARRAKIISAARRIAELEGWPNVTVRRLADEISYSQPVLYGHFGSREGVLAAVAIEGFKEMGLALQKSRKRPNGEAFRPFSIRSSIRSTSALRLRWRVMSSCVGGFRRPKF